MIWLSKVQSSSVFVHVYEVGTKCQTLSHERELIFAHEFHETKQRPFQSTNSRFFMLFVCGMHFQFYLILYLSCLTGLLIH